MSEKKKVVMIDDEQDLCALVKANLEETEEFEVVIVSDSIAALQVCENEKPDIILVDNVMPQKKGSELVKDFKTSEILKKTPIIMVSGKGEMVYAKGKKQFQWLPNNPRARERGEIVEGKDPEILSQAYQVDDYIAKPFATDLLIDVINEVLEKKRKQRQVEENAG